MITGDRVLLGASERRISVALLPGSPHDGRSVASAATPDGRLVIPRLPVREMSRLDLSLFNTTALATDTRDGRVPIVVTFAAGARPHAITGLDLDLAAARPAVGGGLSVRGSYSVGYAGLPPSSRALDGVRRIALPSARPTAPASAPTRPTHHLTIRLSTASGHPAPFAVGFVENVDDSSRYLETPEIQNGVVKLTVPDGNYAVMAYTFQANTRLVIAPEFSVRGDTTVKLDLADATLRPHVSLPGHVMRDSTVSVARLPDRGFAFDLEFGAPHLWIRLQPASGSVSHGSLSTAVFATLVPAGERNAEAPSMFAVTGDERPGIPATMDVHHAPSDFAVMPQVFHANGPAGLRLTDFFVFMPPMHSTLGEEFPAHVPGRRTVWLQASAKTYYQQDLYPTDTPRHQRDIVQLARSSRYPSAGAAAPVQFARGPVGPGIEARFDKAKPGRFCLFCRVGNRIHGSLPLFSGARSAMFGYLGKPDGAWTLSRGAHEIASGHSEIDPSVTVPAVMSSYTLRAESHPQSSLWQLSTEVSDAWTFRSGTGRATIPLLFASYVPPMALDGSLGPGPTRFRLDFGNAGRVDSRVVRAQFSLSTDDGKTWRDAKLSRLDKNSFLVTYTNPARGQGHYDMSLRVRGVDAAGRIVRETALRVYHLTPGG